MLVTPETHQPPMAPYFAVAAAAFKLYSVAAVFRSALLVKVCPVQAGGGEGEGGGGLGEGCGTAPAAIVASWTSIAYRFPCIDLFGNTSASAKRARGGHREIEPDSRCNAALTNGLGRARD